MSMKPEISVLKLGELETNCYIVWCPKTLAAVVIDPADSGEVITEEILRLGLKPEAILLTHGHFDHVLGLLALKLNFSLPTALHPKDTFLLKGAQKSAEHWLHHPVDPIPTDIEIPLTHHQLISFGECQLKVVHTPGHSPGSVCFYTGSEILTGDTLFANTIGRTNLSYSSFKDLHNSLQQVFNLPAETLVLPGHGESERLSEVKKTIESPTESVLE